jgi:pimeloyl-ACP methyl ester carboxylesterase
MNERKTRIETIIADKPVGISVREWRVSKPVGQVICLHGFGVNGAEFGPMADRLNRLRYDVLMPDWIGHGDSDYLGDPAAYTWDCYQKCLGTVMRRYDAPRTHYVGTSWGGALLLLFMLARPVLPQSAIFVDVPIKASPTLARHQDVFEAQKALTFETIEEANQFLQKQRPEFARVPPRFQDYLDTERFAVKDGRVSFKFDPAILTAAVRTTANHNWTVPLARLRFNVLFLYGQASPYRSVADFMSICAKIPTIRYRDDLPGGHPPMLLHEEQYQPIIEFIRQASRS